MFRYSIRELKLIDSNCYWNASSNAQRCLGHFVFLNHSAVLFILPPFALNKDDCLCGQPEMRIYVRWSVALGLMGGIVQYRWLSMIDALSRQSGLVTIATALFGILTVLWFEPFARRKSGRAKLVGFVACIFASSFAALGSFVIAEGMERTDAIRNSIGRHPVEFFVLNTLGLGGWLVGILYGFAIFLSRETRAGSN